MLIICPKCFAKYEVDERLLHDNIQVFQCTECHHRFEEHLELPFKKISQNETQTPTSYPSVVSDAVQNASLGNGTIPSSKDFIAEHSTVLPEAFTPIENKPEQRGRKALAVVFMLLFMMMVSGGVYFWMAKDVLLEQYPSVRKVVSLLNDKTAQSVAIDNQLPMEDDGVVADSSDGYELSANDIIDLTKTDGVQMPERILPVETDNIVPVASDDMNTQHKEQKLSEEVVELVEMPLEDAVSGSNDVLQEIPHKPLEDNKLSADSNLQDHPVILGAETVRPDEVVNIADGVAINEQAEGTEDILMPADVSGEIVSVQIKDVTFKKDTTDKTLSRIFVQGMVENTSGVIGVIPPLQAQLYDKDNVLLSVRDLPYAPTMIQPKSPEFFFYELSEVPTGSVAKVNVIVKGQ